MTSPDRRNRNSGAEVGICVYSAEQWTRFRAVVADPEDVEETHEEWVAMMKRSLRKFREAGIRYELVDVDVEELVRWCERKRRPINRAARAEYASYLLSRRSKH